MFSGAKSRSDVDVAASAVDRARGRRDEAEQELAVALDVLDRALADVGWTRVLGAFSPDAVPLYKSVLYPDALLTIDQLFAHLDQHRKAVA